KGRSAHFVNLSLGISGKLWQPGFYDRALRRENDRKAIARYIVANPLRKGIVKSVSDYSFWNSDFL
ncbi:transposase, partial [Oceanospirillum sp. HFRX-1_2]